MGTAERRQREREQRRGDILDAAQRVFFAHQGIEQSTMDDIARAAELSKGTLYLYFRDKEDLLAAINVRGLHILRELIAQAVASPGTALERVGLLGEAYYRFAVDHCDFFKVMNEMRLFIHDFDGELDSVQECVALAGAVLGMVAQLIAQGQQEGSIRSDLQPAAVAAVLYGQMSGVLSSACSGDEHVLAMAGGEAHNLVRTALQMCMQGLRA